MAFESVSSVANPAPILPQPMANADLTNPTTPDIGQNAAPIPGTFGAKLSAALASPAPPPGPGNWARALVGHAVDALSQRSPGAANAVAASLGDASHAADNLRPGQGGALAGITNVLAARNQRVQQQQQQQFENNLKTAEEQRRDKEAQQQAALNTMQMAVHQKQLDQYDQKARQDVYSSNKDASKSREDSGFTVQHGVNENDLQNQINNFKSDDPKFKHFSDKYEALPIGEIEVNGQRVKQYDIVEKNGRPTKVSDDEAKFIADNGGPNIAGGETTTDNLATLRQQAQRTATARQSIEDFNQRQFTADEKKQLNSELHTPAVQHALASNADRLQGIEDGINTAQQHIQHGQQLAQQAKTPEGKAEAQQYVQNAQSELKSLQHVAAFGFTPDERKEHLENQRKTQEFNEHEQDRRDAKGRTKLYDQAHEAWQQSLADNDFNPVTAREALRKTNPKMLAALADEESRSAQVTESTDPITGETRQTTKGKPSFFAVPAPQRSQQQPQTVGQLTGAAANFQKSQDQEATQQQQQQQTQQDQYDQRPAEKPSMVVMGQVNPNGKYNQAEKYITDHPELSGPDRAAVRKQFAQTQQTQTGGPPPGVTIPQGYVWRANGPNGPGAYKQ